MTVTASKNIQTGKYETDSQVEIKVYISFTEGQVSLFSEELETKIQVIKFKDKLTTKNMGKGFVFETYTGYYAPSGDLIQVSIGYENNILKTFAVSNRNVLISYMKIEPLK